MVVLAPLGIIYCSTRSDLDLNRLMKIVLDEVPFFANVVTRDLSVYSLTLGEAWQGKGPVSTVTTMEVSPDNDADRGEDCTKAPDEANTSIPIRPQL